MFRHGLSTLGCAEFTLAQTLALAARHRLDAVELRALENTTDLPTLFAARHGTPAKFAAVLAASPVRVVAFDTSFKLIGSNPSDREALLAFVPWAEAAGVRWLRVFDGGKTADAAELAEAVDHVRWWQELRRAHGWTTDLMVETHDALTTTPAILRFVAAAPGCGILWDTHHTWKKGGEDPVATWRAIAPHVVHVHVKDSVSRPSARHSFTYVLPGKGEFPMSPLLAALRAGFSGVVSLEWERLWHPYLPPLDDALSGAATRHWW